MQRKRGNGKLGLLVILGLLTCGCATPTKYWGYQAKVPLLTYRPMVRECTVSDTKTGEREEAQCILVYAPDWYELIAEIKAACLASGQPPDECQTVKPAPQKTEPPQPKKQSDT